MNEIQLVEQFAQARGLRLRGEISRESAREVLLPLLILDIAYNYIQRLPVRDFRFEAKKQAKAIHESYNRINQWFFAGLKDQLEDEAIALMDALEESVNLAVLVTETSCWNIFKAWPEPVCGQLVAGYMTYLLAAGAGAAWEHIFRSADGHETRNRSTLRIMAASKRLSIILMGNENSDVQERRVKELRSAESALGRKLVRWTRQTGTDEH